MERPVGICLSKTASCALFSKQRREGQPYLTASGGKNWILLALLIAWNCIISPAELTSAVQADVSGTVVKWLVDNGAQITPGQVPT